MLQLDLFGGEPAKPTQPKKKAYQLVKPAVLVEKDEEAKTAEGVEVTEKVEGVDKVEVVEVNEKVEVVEVNEKVEGSGVIAEKIEEAEKVEVVEVIEEQSVEKEVVAVIAEKDEEAEEVEVVEVVEVIEEQSFEKEVVAVIAEKDETVEENEGVDKVEVVEKVEGDAKKSRARIPLDISRLNPSSPKINVPEDEVLFSKQYYPIGEVAAMFNVNISLIRFWEKEFDILQPRKNGKGDRLFRPEDIKNLKMIFFLLKEKKYTIEGAKTFLKKGKKATQGFETVETLKNIKSMLIVLKSSL